MLNNPNQDLVNTDVHTNGQNLISYVVGIMHVPDTYKFKMEQINSKQEEVETSFLDPKGQLTQWCVVKSGNISNTSKLSFM